MSCPHGNSDGECDLCAELDAKWDAGYAAGKKTATVEIEAVRASALVEIDRLRAEKAALREQLQGGVVVPRETLERWMLNFDRGCAYENIPPYLRAILAAAKETKHG